MSLALAAALITAVLQGSGCGGQSSVDPVAKAAEVTTREVGEQITLSERMSSPALSSPITIEGSGYMNLPGREGVLNMHFRAGAGAPAPLANGTARALFKYPLIYIKWPFLSGKLPGGKQWLLMNVEKASQAAGLNVSGLSSASEVDPTQYLSYLRGSSGHVTRLGTDTINGVSTTHYKATILFDRISSRLPASQRAGAEAAVRQLEKLTASRGMPVEVWVDSRQRVRRQQLTINEHLAQGTPVEVLARVDYVSFGPNPKVTTPASSQVYDATSAAAAGMKKALGKS
jgi:hypothetical protein